MEKVLIIIPDNNKGKYISKGFSEAFKALGFFSVEKKIYDINPKEVEHISPDIIFIFHSGLNRSEIIDNIFDNLNNDEKLIKIHCAELNSDIPAKYKKQKNTYCFTSDSKTIKYKYIPAVSQKEYKTKFDNYLYTITFAGNPAYPNREKLLSRIIYNFGALNIFCRSFDFYKSIDDIYKNKLLNDNYLDIYRNSYKGYVETQKELAQIYNASKINIDIPNGNTKPINYRCIEITASGGFLIAPYSDELVHIFENGKELDTYRNEYELIDKITFYLKNVNIAQLISSKGRKNVLSNHTFYDRLKSMMRNIYGKDISN